jgi:hypothetical protein
VNDSQPGPRASPFSLQEIRLLWRKLRKADILIGTPVELFVQGDEDALPNLVYVNNLIRFAVLSPVF